MHEFAKGIECIAAGIVLGILLGYLLKYQFPGGTEKLTPSLIFFLPTQQLVFAGIVEEPFFPRFLGSIAQIRLERFMDTNIPDGSFYDWASVLPWRLSDLVLDRCTIWRSCYRIIGLAFSLHRNEYGWTWLFKCHRTDGCLLPISDGTILRNVETNLR